MPTAQPSRRQADVKKKTNPHPPSKTHAPIDLSLLVASLANPRKTFDRAGMSELTESIRQHGVLQPILVRRFPETRTPPKGFADAHTNGFEVIVGERRLRAAQTLGLDVIPVVVRDDVSNGDALKLQLVENLQRADLHPIEEAEGYEDLIEHHGLTADDVAAKVGKSKAYVYARLKLTALCTAARKAFYGDELSASTALLVARIPDDGLQVEAVKEITAGDITVREASELIQSRYMLQLDGAPFPVTDAELVPKAGACSTCPKLTGNQRALFPDVKSGEVCTDPKCFAAKRAAQWEITSQEAVEKGQAVLTPTQRKREFPYSSDQLRQGSKYAALDQRCYFDSDYRSYRKMLGKDAPPVVAIAEHPHTGKPLQLVEKKALDAALAKKKKSSVSKADTDFRAESRRQVAAQRERFTVNAHIAQAVLEKQRGAGLGETELRFVAGAFFEDIWHEHQKRVFRLLDWEIKKGAHLADEAQKRIGKLRGVELARFLLLLSLVKDVEAPAHRNGKKSPLMILARRHHVNVPKIKREVTAAAKAKKKTPKKAARKSTGKK